MLFLEYHKYINSFVGKNLNYEVFSYNLFLQHALNDSFWKTQNIALQISGKIKRLLVTKTSSSPKIKIILSKNEKNKIEN